MTGQSETKHTPGELSVRPYGDGDSLVIHAGDDWRICFMATPGDSPNAMQRIKADAARIVLTWNCHDELVAALEWYADEMCEYSAGFEGCGLLSSDDCAGCKARAALSRATSPTP